VRSLAARIAASPRWPGCESGVRQVSVAPLVFCDDDVRARLDAGAAVAAMRQALVDAERGVLRAPPRVSADVGGGRLVFTTGARRGRWFGYRSYDTFAAEPGAQVVVAHDWQTGRVVAIAVGNELGPRRTGATGGLAVDVLARPGAARAGLIGTGVQAWAQLWAVAAVRPLSDVAVWSRDGQRRAAFARRARDELSLDAREAASAEEAARGRDIVVLATNSARPVIDPAWIGPGCHVTTLGPKQQGRAEFDAAFVLAQWRQEIPRRDLDDPAPLAVHWRLTELDVMDHTDHIVGQNWSRRQFRPERMQFSCSTDRMAEMASQFRRLARRRLVILGEPGT